MPAETARIMPQHKTAYMHMCTLHAHVHKRRALNQPQSKSGMRSFRRKFGSCSGHWVRDEPPRLLGHRAPAGSHLADEIAGSQDEEAEAAIASLP
mmetsp:Transcript_145/g.185  ORF Transcript_145/g.185 Transcript_145/m.185 type:complete len:95 (-) Transcript_145:355-639(-)